MLKEQVIAQGWRTERLVHKGVAQEALCTQWTGARSVLLFLPPHGAGSEIWIRVMQRLKGSNDCLALDVPGFASPGEATLDTWVALVARWITRFSPGQALVLVGSSLGGIVAMRAAAACPGAVSRVITLGLHPSMGSLHALEGTFDVASAEDVNRLFQRTWARPPALGPAVASEILSQMQAPVFQGLVREISRCDLALEFRRAVSNGVSVRFLMGREDRIAAWDETQGEVKVKGTVIEDCGHYPQSEQPKTCADLIARSMAHPTEKGDVACQRM